MFIQIKEYLINTDTITYIELEENASAYNENYIDNFSIRIQFARENLYFNFTVSKEIKTLIADIACNSKNPKFNNVENLKKIEEEIARAKKERDDVYSEILSFLNLNMMQSWRRKDDLRDN